MCSDSQRPTKVIVIPRRLRRRECHSASKPIFQDKAVNINLDSIITVNDESD